ncbi:uncharacterized protein LOC117302407 [Asterias rubens]|uniref:Somatostatin n=1 Tax=Asterias rubens TaxID=7604 RepID=A0A6G8IRE9_ASTRU|nr:uncharacterized protein LOC117302407 [Asterias rubens]QIM55700.1 somatostatin precursor [Asterias rubens]
MNASPMMSLVVVALCALLVVCQADLTDIGNSDIMNEPGSENGGFLHFLREDLVPRYLLRQGGMKKRPFSNSNDMDPISEVKRRAKNARCMADFWKGRGLVDC